VTPFPAARGVVDHPFIAIPGTYNFRDLGGLRARDGFTRRGILIRGEAPAMLGEAGRRALGRLGVRTAIDLRERPESELHPSDLFDLPITLHAHAVFDGFAPDPEQFSGLLELYLHILERFGNQLAGAITTLSRPGALPGLVFCTAGKDRTGLLCALILSAVGVDDEDIAADYALTSTVMEGEFLATVLERSRAAGYPVKESAVAAPDVAVANALMRLVLNAVRVRYGGTAQYLVRHGVSASGLDLLRGALVEPAAGTTDELEEGSDP
jgi:protein-tyrosine phosphatase